MSKSSYIPFIIGLLAVFTICCLAISGSFSTTLREGFFDPDIKTSGILGIGRKAPDVSVSRWKGQPVTDLGTPISSNPNASGNYTLTNEKCPAIPRPTKWGPTGCKQFRGGTPVGPGDQPGEQGAQCTPPWDPKVTSEWTAHVGGGPSQPDYWKKEDGTTTVTKPPGFGEPPPPASWCDYNPAPSINGGNPLCVIENQCSKGNLCDLETQRCATPDSNFILVETQTQCPLKPAPSGAWLGAVEGSRGFPKPQDASDPNTPYAFGPDNLPAQTCSWTDSPVNAECPKICQAPGRLGWDAGIGVCRNYYEWQSGENTGLQPMDAQINTGGGTGAMCTNNDKAYKNPRPSKCAFRQSCPSGQLCDMNKNKCMALCKKGDEKCKTEAWGPPPPPGTQRPAWPGPSEMDPSCKDAISVSFAESYMDMFSPDEEDPDSGQPLKTKYGCIGGTCTTTCANAATIKDVVGWSGTSSTSIPPQVVKDACPITLKTGCGTMPRAPPPFRQDCPSIRGNYPGWAVNIYAPGVAGSVNDDTLNCKDRVNLALDGAFTNELMSKKKGSPSYNPYELLSINGFNCHGCPKDAKHIPQKPLNPLGGEACGCPGAYRDHPIQYMSSDVVGMAQNAMMGNRQCRYSRWYGGSGPVVDDKGYNNVLYGDVGTGCSGRGVCSAQYSRGGFCVCDPGYSGIDCSIKDDDPSANVIPASLPPAWCGWMDPAVAPGPYEIDTHSSWMKAPGWADADAPGPIKVSTDYCADKPPRGWTEDMGQGGGALQNLKDYKHSDVYGCYRSTPQNPIPGCRGKGSGLPPGGGSGSPPSGGSSPPPSGGSSPPPSGGSSPPPSGGSSPPPSGGSSPPPSGGSSPPPSGGNPWQPPPGPGPPPGPPPGPAPPPSGGNPWQPPPGPGPPPGPPPGPGPPPSGGNPWQPPSGGSSPPPNAGSQINRYTRQNGRTYKKGQYQPAPNPHFHFEIPGPAYTCKAGQQWCVALQKCSLLNDCPK